MHNRIAIPAGSTLLSILFLAVLCLPALDMLFGLDPAPPPPELPSSPWPPHFTPSWPGMALFLQELHGFAEHVGFRDFAIRAWMLLNTQVLTQLGRVLLPADVVWGSHGWLFLSAQNMLQDYRRETPLGDKELDAWLDLFESRDQWLRAQGSKYLIVFAPNKQSIYPEEYPASVDRADGMSRMGQVIEYLKANSSVEFLDLRPFLSTLKLDHQVYLKTDPHWTPVTRFIVAQEILRVLQFSFPALALRTLSDYDIAYVDSAGGNLSERLTLADVLIEPNKSVMSYRGDSLGHDVPSPQYQALSDRGIVRRVVETGVDTLPTAVLLGDSFGIHASWFMFDHFRRIVTLRRRNFDSAVLEVLSRETPDIVIHEILERYFASETMRPDPPR